MGGSGSTRWNRHARRREVGEDTVAIDVRHLRELIARQDGTEGTIEWTYGGAKNAMKVVIDTRANGTRTMTLTYDYLLPDSTKFSVHDAVTLEAVPVHFGGRRWWLRCPRCDARRRAVYLAPGATRFACRACAGLAYHTQRLEPSDRLLRRARKIVGRIGRSWLDGSAWLPGELPPAKPKRMHWRTYNRWVDALATIEDRRDELFMISLRRILDRAARYEQRRVE